MPATLEVKCANEDCELDMFELHYTYDMPDDVTGGVLLSVLRRTGRLDEVEL